MKKLRTDSPDELINAMQGLDGKLGIDYANHKDVITWMQFFNGRKREDFAEMAEKNDDLRVAYDKLSQMSADEQKRAEYEARQKAIWDHNTLINYAREEGAAKERANTELERQRADEAEERQAEAEKQKAEAEKQKLEAERTLAEAEQENARLRAALQAQNLTES